MKKIAIFVAGVALGAYAMYNHLYKKITSAILDKESEEEIKEDE